MTITHTILAAITKIPNFSLKSWLISIEIVFVFVHFVNAYFSCLRFLFFSVLIYCLLFSIWLDLLLCLAPKIIILILYFFYMKVNFAYLWSQNDNIQFRRYTSRSPFILETFWRRSFKKANATRLFSSATYRFIGSIFSFVFFVTPC